MDAAERRRRWQLVLPHRTYLVRIAIRRGMSPHDAEDCAQEAMVRCVDFPGLDETRVLEFLATTTMRLCVDRHRLHARDLKVSAKLLPWYVEEPSPEEEACDRGEASWVAAHVARLPESQRTALAAKAEGLSCHEIAARMDLSYKAVESLLSRARAYVRAAVAMAWVLVARMRRRGLDVPDGVPAMALAALVTASVLAPRDAVPPPATVAAPATVVTAGTPRVVPARAAAPAVVPAPAPRPASTPAPSAGEQEAGDPGGGLPLPTPVPTDPCDLRLPHVETCVPVKSYKPGEGLRSCLANGPQISPRGVDCSAPNP
jgi:RNA polymerase sigma factor (sigma-70 family)